jgi:hypothetical protein
MKNNSNMIIFSKIVLSLCCLFWISASNAGSISDPNYKTDFVSGETLTAQELTDNFTEIQTQVDENDGRITTNAGDISVLDNALSDLTAISALFAGDGSAGTLNIAANTDWTSTFPTNTSFTDCTIAAGFTLTVPAGTVIRCTGGFTNNGTISVASVGNNGYFFIYAQGSNTMQQQGIGDAYSQAGEPSYSRDFGTTPTILSGGFGSSGIPQAVAVSSWNRFRMGGSAGSAHQAGSSSSGGGLLKIMARGAIANTGQITADGTVGSQGGGGGGGIVVMASLVSVTNASGASIDANGGAGGAFQSNNGAGGGGGGGIVVMVAPTIDNAGTVNVAGGAAGTPNPTAGAVASAQSSGGGGGGACGGNGGNGGQVLSTGEANAASDGLEGYVIELLANPATML